MLAPADSRTLQHATLPSTMATCKAVSPPAALLSTYLQIRKMHHLWGHEAVEGSISLLDTNHASEQCYPGAYSTAWLVSMLWAPFPCRPAQPGGLVILIDQQSQYAGMAAHGSMMQCIPPRPAIHCVCACTLLQQDCYAGGSPGGEGAQIRLSRSHRCFLCFALLHAHQQACMHKVLLGKGMLQTRSTLKDTSGMPQSAAQL